MTRELAWAAATDAGNRHMRKHGRSKWNHEDSNVAAKEFARLWPHENPSYGMDLDLETSMAPAWMYYETKEARDQAARVWEGQGKKIIREQSFFGYKQAGGKKYRLRAADHRGNPSQQRYLLFGLSLQDGGVDESGTVRGSVVRVNHGLPVEVLRKSGHRLLVKGNLSGKSLYGWVDDSNVATKSKYHSTHGADPETMYNPGDFYQRTMHDNDYHEIGEHVTSSVYGPVQITARRETNDPEKYKYEYDITPVTKRGRTRRSMRPYGPGPGKRYRGNPAGDSEEMFESFHGEPSDETVEYTEEEHYHGNLAALGELVELKVKLVNGDKAVIGFDAGSGEQADNPFWPFNSFTKTTIYHVGTGEKYKKSGSFKGYTLYQKLDTGEFLVPALDKDSRFDTLKDAKAFINSWTKHQKNPATLDEHAAKELELYVENDADLYRQQYTPINKNLITKMARGVYNHTLAVKAFGYLMESGAKKYAKEYSEGKDWHQIFSPATRKHVAELFTNHFETEAKLGNYDSLLPKKYQKKNPRGKRGHGGPFREAGKLVGSITSGASRPMDEFIGAAGKVGGYLDDQIGRALNPNHPDTGPTLLCSNKDGTQLFFKGGDQSLDLNALNITGPEAQKELIHVGQVTHITYHTRKLFGKKPEEFDYVHKFSEDSHGPLPVLNYDRINKQLQLSGGMYKIEKPLLGTSPGIED
jgi:hypothetical protein